MRRVLHKARCQGAYGSGSTPSDGTDGSQVNPGLAALPHASRGSHTAGKVVITGRRQEARGKREVAAEKKKTSQPLPNAYPMRSWLACLRAAVEVRHKVYALRWARGVVGRGEP
ncbi:hypothetical protein O3P69_010435 [Scylla paramamosain]|uniref:Uncharacterized protein n=1 Tax=Scylla paramamosain TaxID=85552 RepID=A0AAW0TX06_SCYPA